MPFDAATDVGELKSGEMGRYVAWWAKSRKLQDIVETEKLIPVYHDLAVICATHLVRRMANLKTPDDVKDKIALTFAPRLTAEFKGKLNKGEGGKESPVNDLMGEYRLG